VRSPRFHTVPYSRNENGFPKLSRAASGKYDADRSRVRKSTGVLQPRVPALRLHRWPQVHLQHVDVVPRIDSVLDQAADGVPLRVEQRRGSAGSSPFGPGTLSVWNGRMLRYD
jgi:hypothetical protein